MSTDPLLVRPPPQPASNDRASAASPTLSTLGDGVVVVSYRSFSLSMAALVCASALASRSRSVQVLDLVCAALLVLGGVRLSALALSTMLLQAASMLSRPSEVASGAAHQVLALAMVCVAPVWCHMSVNDALAMAAVALATTVASWVLIAPPALFQFVLLVPVSLAAFLHAADHDGHKRQFQNNEEVNSHVHKRLKQRHLSKGTVDFINMVVNDAAVLLDNMRERPVLSHISNEHLDNLQEFANRLSLSVSHLRPLIKPAASGRVLEPDRDTRRWLQEMLHPNMLPESDEASQNNAGIVANDDSLDPAVDIQEEKSLSISGVFRSRPEEEKKFKTLVKNIGCWKMFDIFAFSQLSNDMPCFSVGLVLLHKFNLVSKLNLDRTKLSNLLQKIDAGYHDIPYHNHIHAADVAHACSFLIVETGLIEMLTDIDILALVIGSLFHDYGHPGLSNSFLVATRHPLALTYNDDSCLENYHVSSAFKLLFNDPDCTILKDFPEKEMKQFRSAMIQLVLSTDMARHFPLLMQFKSRSSGTLPYHRDSFEDRVQLMQIAIKCADINHPSKPWHLHLKWSERVNEEFFEQGDTERRLGLPMSAFMNRESTQLWKSQIGFIDFLVYPLFESFMRHWEERPETERLIMSQIQSNRSQWQTLSDENNIADKEASSDDELKLK